MSKANIAIHFIAKMFLQNSTILHKMQAIFCVYLYYFLKWLFFAYVLSILLDGSWNVAAKYNPEMAHNMYRVGGLYLPHIYIDFSLFIL